MFNTPCQCSYYYYYYYYYDCCCIRNVHGLIKSLISIDGRVRIAEAERFVNESLKSGRKLVVPFRIYTTKNKNSPSYAGYQKFVDEFTRDERSGLCNVIPNQVSVYIFPPALKDSISFLKGFHIDKDISRALYGIIVCRESLVIDTGTVNSSRSFEEVNLNDPPEPTSSTSTSSSSNSSSVTSSSSSVVQKVANVVPPPPMPPSSSSLSSTAAAASVSKSSGSNVVPVPVVPPPVFRPTAATPQSMTAVPPPPVAPSIVPMVSATPAVPQVPPHVPAVAVTAPPPIPPIIRLAVSEENIRKVAGFCAANGAQTIEILKNKPEAQTIMPFLFAGGEGHQMFLDILKSILNR